MPKFQILQDKGEIKFNSNKTSGRLWLLNFMMCNGCRYCLEAEDLLCETIGQPLHVIKSKMAGCWKFKSHNLFLFFLTI